MKRTFHSDAQNITALQDWIHLAVITLTFADLGVNIFFQSRFLCGTHLKNDHMLINVEALNKWPFNKHAHCCSLVSLHRLRFNIHPT